MSATRPLYEKLLYAFRKRSVMKVQALSYQRSETGGRVTIPDEALTADAVPRRWGWKQPSLAQEFALSFDGDGIFDGGVPDGFALLGNAQTSGYESLAPLSLTELRATLYTVQRVCRWTEDKPDAALVRALLKAIRIRLTERDAGHGASRRTDASPSKQTRRKANAVGAVATRGNRLVMNIKREHFAAILSVPCRKTIEYRDLTPYWLKRLERIGDPPFELRLLNGMLPPVPEATVRVERIVMNKRTKTIELHLGRILSVKHWDRKAEKRVK